MSQLTGYQQTIGGFVNKILLGLLVVASSASAFAVGSAGCGLGSMIFKEDTIASQTLAETTNGSSLTQFFGITTGTSNCSAHGFAYINKEATVYAEANMPSLKIEMARGQGENLTAFSQILGCKDVSSFSKMTKSKYQSIFPSNEVNAQQMLQNLSSEIQNDSNLKQSCHINS